MDERMDALWMGGSATKAQIMRKAKGMALSEGAVAGLLCLQHYRYCTIPQFASIAKCSVRHGAYVLRELAERNMVGYFGFVGIPGQGKTPKVYFLKKEGWELLRNYSDIQEEELGPFHEVHQESTWAPQMFHRLRLLDLFFGLETQVRELEHLRLLQTLLEYRRVGKTHKRETMDFVGVTESPEHRIIPDGAFVLENSHSGRRGLFFVENGYGHRAHCRRGTEGSPGNHQT